MEDRPCYHCAHHQSTRQVWRPGHPGGWRGSDFNVPRCWVIPVWRRRCPSESWHVARCLHKIMASVKLLYSRKNVWCWLPHGCADQHGSFLKLRLLSHQQRNRHICGWVKMKQYGTTDKPPTSGSTKPGRARYRPDQGLRPGCRPGSSYVNWVWSPWNSSKVPSWKPKLRIFELRLTSLPIV